MSVQGLVCHHVPPCRRCTTLAPATPPPGPPRQDVTWFPLSERHKAAAETAPCYGWELWDTLGAAPASEVLGDTVSP